MERDDLYQLIIARLDGDRIGDRQYVDGIRRLVMRGIGGFILFGGEKDLISPFIGQLQSLSGVPLFIASDVERGVGQQVRGATRFPSQMAVAAAVNRDNPDDVSLLDSALCAWASEARDIGINMAFSPVLDVNRNPSNPIICTRAFSDDPDTVSWFGSRYADAFLSQGILCCAKHFPGHGDTETDSHMSLPFLRQEMQDLRDVDLRPFSDAISRGIPCLMAGHLVIPALDTLPASLSPSVISGLLKGSMGFTGIVITDALNMHALNNYRNIGAMSLLAGADILLHPADPDLMVREISDALDNGTLEQDRVQRAIARIIEAKNSLPAAGSATIDYSRHQEIAGALFRRSVTVLKQDVHLRGRPVAEKRRLVAIGDGFDYAASPLRRIPLAGDDVTDQEVLIVVFSKVAAWKGSSGISDGDRARIRSLIRNARSSIVVSFGSPYVLSHFREADMLVAAYDDADAAQESVLHWLFSADAPPGKSPVGLHV